MYCPEDKRPVLPGHPVVPKGGVPLRDHRHSDRKATIEAEARKRSRRRSYQ